MPRCTYTAGGELRCQEGGMREEFGDPKSKKNCALSPWSEWSECVRAEADNCNGMRFRTRSIVTPPLNGGSSCGVLGDTDRCDVYPPPACGNNATAASKYKNTYFKNNASITLGKAWNHYNTTGRHLGYTWTAAPSDA